MWEENSRLNDNWLRKIIRNDEDKRVLVIKEVHDLMSIPRIVKGLDYQVVFISR